MYVRTHVCVRHMSAVGSLLVKEWTGGPKFDSRCHQSLTMYANTQIACILAASLIFSGYYLVMTSLSCQICGKTPAKLTES